jgi:general secretion pathway protein D
MAKTRDIYVDEKLNLLVVRDTPEAIRLVEKLVALADRPDPEVMLEIEILEVKRTRLQELGVQWPTQFSVIPQGGEEILTTLQELRNLSSSDIGVFPRPSVRISKDTSDVNLLANPRIRVKNKEKAKIHIGDKVPVITSNVTSTGVTSESVSYLDVGLKVDVEPLVHMENEVGIKVGLEVSNIVRSVTTDNGTLVYQIGSRNASTSLRLKDGETQVLAGLISDEDRTGSNRVPALGDLPLLGRLFSTQTDDLIKTEIVLLITPRIIRNIERPELIDGEFFAGTESTASDQPLQLRPAVARPASRPGSAADEEAEEAEPEEAPAGQPEPPPPQPQPQPGTVPAR